MTKNAKKKAPRPLKIPGVVHINIQIPAHLHKAMKAIRLKRRKAEMMDVKLQRLYREAIELYVTEEIQERLLNGQTLRHTA